VSCGRTDIRRTTEGKRRAPRRHRRRDSARVKCKPGSVAIIGLRAGRVRRLFVVDWVIYCDLLATNARHLIRLTWRPGAVGISPAVYRKSCARPSGMARIVIRRYVSIVISFPSETQS